MNNSQFDKRKSGVLVPRNFSLTYEAARYSRHRKWLPIIQTDSKDILTPGILKQLRSEARHAFVNSGIVRGAFRDRAQYLAGNEGIVPFWDSGDPAWDQEMLDRWRNWLRIADVRRLLHFNQILRNSSIEFDCDGDHGIILTETGGGNEKGGMAQIQTVRAHRIDDPEAANDGGVLFDRRGVQVVAYRIREGDSDYRDIPASSFIMIGDPDLSDWVRFPSAIAHGINTIADVREIQGLCLDGIKTRTARAFWRQTPTGDVDEDDLLTDIADNSENTLDDLTLEEIQGGEIPRLGPGEELHELVSDYPGQLVAPTLEFNLRDFMVGYGTPLEVCWGGNLKGPTQRFFITKFQRAVDSRRRIIYIPKVMHRIASYFAAKEIKRGAMPFRPLWWPKRYMSTSPDVSIDAGRDADADRDDMIFGSRTLDEDACTRGMDWRHLRDQSEAEADDLIVRAKRLAKKNDVTFEVALSILSLRTPNGNLPAAPAKGSAAPPVNDD